MKICPSCESHSWSDDAYGAVQCPQCKATIKLMAGAITEAPKPASYRPNSNKPNRSGTLVNGKVLCACCHRPFCLGETLNGVIETERRTRVVKVQIGWRLLGETFYPAMEERYIPSQVRGQICIACMTSFGGRHVGQIAKPKDEHVEAVIADVRTNGLPRERDPEPKWAHTNDPHWLSANACRPVEYDDSKVSDLVLLDRMVKRLPLRAWNAPAPEKSISCAVHVAAPVGYSVSAAHWTAHKCKHGLVQCALCGMQDVQAHPAIPAPHVITRPDMWLPSETLCCLVNEVASLMGSDPVCPVVQSARRGVASRVLIRCKAV